MHLPTSKNTPYKIFLSFSLFISIFRRDASEISLSVSTNFFKVMKIFFFKMCIFKALKIFTEKLTPFHQHQMALSRAFGHCLLLSASGGRTAWFCLPAKDARRRGVAIADLVRGVQFRCFCVYHVPFWIKYFWIRLFQSSLSDTQFCLLIIWR